MKRYVFAVIELADPYGPPLDQDCLSDIAACVELGSTVIAAAVVYASLSDLASDVIDGVLALPDEALRPIHGTPKGG